MNSQSPSGIYREIHKKLDFFRGIWDFLIIKKGKTSHQMRNGKETRYQQLSISTSTSTTIASKTFDSGKDSKMKVNSI